MPLLSIGRSMQFDQPSHVGCVGGECACLGICIDSGLKLIRKVLCIPLPWGLLRVVCFIPVVDQTLFVNLY